MRWNLRMKAARAGDLEVDRAAPAARRSGPGDQRGEDVDGLDNHPELDQARGPRRDPHRVGGTPSDFVSL